MSGRRPRFITLDGPSAVGKTREVRLYTRAARTLAGLGVAVLVLDSGCITPSEAAERIAHRITGP